MTTTTTEEWLDSLLVTWRLVDVPLAEIDPLRSVQNQARKVAVDNDVVERYEADMRAGDQFPPILAHRRTKTARLVVLGGNHRFAATRKIGAETIPAFVIDCDDETAVRITYEDNRRHGLPPSDEERCDHAVHLINLGWKREAAARAVGVTISKVGRAIEGSRTEARVIELGVDVQRFAKLPTTSKWRLGGIKSDPIFVAMTKLACDAGLTGEQIYPLVSAVNAARSEAAANLIIDTERSKQASKIRDRGKKNRSSKTAREIALETAITLANLRPSDVVSSCASSNQRRELGDLLTRVIINASTTIKALGGKLP